MQKLGPYEVLRPLGAGGMGEVYRARDPRLNRDVALKVLPADFASDAVRRARFEQEARAAAALNHPGIVAVHDIGSQDDRLYIASELVEGKTLRTILDRGRLSPKQSLDYATQIAEALAAAHAAGITHRDLKPENTMVTAEGRTKLLDFGLARTLAGNQDDRTMTQLTAGGAAVGTPGYMSPEQARGSFLDFRTDQFSLGVMLHEMLTGENTFRRASAVETMNAVIRDDPESLPAAVPAPVRWVVERCLNKEPAQRFASTWDLYQELKQIRDHASEVLTASKAPPAERLKAGWRRWVLAAACLGAFLAGALTTAWLRPGTEIDFENATLVPFASGNEIETTPAWSPKGDAIAYSAFDGKAFQIFVKQVGAGTASQLTRLENDCFYPAWSADGTRIYFTLVQPYRSFSIWSVALAGGQPQRVMENASHATLSSDGKTLAFRREGDGRLTVGFSSPPGGAPRFSKEIPIAVDVATPTGQSVQFEPGGRDVGMLALTGNQAVLYRVRPEAEPEVLFARNSRFLVSAHFSWFPGARLALISDSEGPENRLIDVKNGSERRFRNGETFMHYASVSPDGDAVAYSSAQMDYDSVSIPLDGGAWKKVAETTLDERSPVWLKDGMGFLVGGKDGLWKASPGGEPDKALLTARDFGESNVGLFDLAISPDGSRLAFRLMSVKYGVSVWISSKEGQTPVPLWRDPRGSPQRGPVWSPDGNWIAYYGMRAGKAAIFKVRVGSNEPAEFVTDRTRLRPVRWSPRGDWLVTDTQPGLNLVSPDGKVVKRLSELTWLTFGFSRDGQDLYGVREGENRRLVVSRVNVDTGAEKMLSDLGPAPADFRMGELQAEFSMRGFSLSPDGKSFLTSVYAEKGDIWIASGLRRQSGLGWWGRVWGKPAN